MKRQKNGGGESCRGIRVRCVLDVSICVRAFQESNIDVATSHNWNRQGNQYVSISHSVNCHRWTLADKCEIYWVQWQTHVRTFLEIDHEYYMSLTQASCGHKRTAGSFLAYCLYFEKKKKTYEAYDITMLSVCLWMNPSTFECLHQSLWNLVCISWHLNSSQLHT
jgi:hypothetical protein